MANYQFAFKAACCQLLLGVMVSGFFAFKNIVMAYSFFSGVCIFALGHSWMAYRLKNGLALSPNLWLKRFYYLEILKSLIMIISFIMLASMDGILILYVFFGYLFAFLIMFLTSIFTSQSKKNC